MPSVLLVRGIGMNNFMNQFNEFQRDPSQFLRNRNINIPDEYMNNPEQAVRYLINNGQMPQSFVNQIMQKANMFGFKF